MESLSVPLTTPAAVAGLALLGAIAGSFLATIVVRWPDRSALSGRSACDACDRPLGMIELVPLAGWLLVRGRCRTCGATIDGCHPAMEFGCAVIGAVAAWVAPGWAGLAGAVFGWLLLTLAVIDARHFWLPDTLVAALALTGAVSAGVAPPAVTDRLVGGAAGFALLWSVAAGYRLVRGREGLGAGDPKMFGAIGLWLGWRLLPAVLVIAGMVGLGWIALRRVRGVAVRGDDMLPFGTLLAVAAYPAWIAMIALAP